jgi:hypothetical protein
MRKLPEYIFMESITKNIESPELNDIHSAIETLKESQLQNDSKSKLKKTRQEKRR